MLNTCHVRYKPNDIGITSEEFLKVLDNLYGHYTSRNIKSVLSYAELTVDQKKDLCNILDVQ